jgi:hypothetical protein
MSDFPERRDESRYQASLPAVLHVGGLDLHCLGYDLSRKGLRLVGAIPAESGPDVEVTLRSAASDLQVRCAAQITRSESEEDGAVHLGLVFSDLDASHVATLEALIARAVEGVKSAALEALPADAEPAQIREALEQTPLAHRIALSVRAQPRERAILFHDPHLQVIDGLARNPQLLPNEVRAMLRMPALLPITLETLARDPRWRGNTELKLAIVAHHSTPLPVAERLCNGIDKDTAGKLIKAPGLNPVLRTKLMQRFSF